MSESWITEMHLPIYDSRKEVFPCSVYDLGFTVRKRRADALNEALVQKDIRLDNLSLIHEVDVFDERLCGH